MEARNMGMGERNMGMGMATTITMINSTHMMANIMVQVRTPTAMTNTPIMVVQVHLTIQEEVMANTLDTIHLIIQEVTMTMDTMERDTIERAITIETKDHLLHGLGMAHLLTLGMVMVHLLLTLVMGMVHLTVPTLGLVMVHLLLILGMVMVFLHTAGGLTLFGLVHVMVFLKVPCGRPRNAVNIMSDVPVVYPNGWNVHMERCS